MDDPEVMWTCDECGKEFSPDPNTMVETSVMTTLVTEKEAKELIARGLCVSFDRKDPMLAKYASGAMCICLECQARMWDESDVDQGGA